MPHATFNNHRNAHATPNFDHRVAYCSRGTRSFLSFPPSRSLSRCNRDRFVAFPFPPSLRRCVASSLLPVSSVAQPVPMQSGSLPGVPPT